MYTECCRIFVLEKDYIEDIVKKYSKENLFLEINFYDYGALVRASSDDADVLDEFFIYLERNSGLFFLKDYIVPDYSLPAEDMAGFFLADRGLTAVTAESCTGGLIAKKLTDRSGSSAYFWGSFVTYDNSAKIMLGVSSGTIEENGAVSSETVHEMAYSAMGKSGADIAVSVSGIAGPGGGSEAKPVGTVWFGIRDAEKASEIKFRFKGSRKAIREKASETALLLIIKNILNRAGVDSIICCDYI